MGEIQVVDRGAREIVVFLSGGFGTDEAEPSAGRFAEAVNEVERLEKIDGLDHVIVNMHGVTAIDDHVVGFLQSLVDRGERRGFEVSFAEMPGAARQVLHDAGWPLVP